MSLAEVEVGDTIMVSLFGKPASPTVVTKVARKYLTVRTGDQFEIATGSYKSQYMGHAMTVEQYDEDQERTRLVGLLRVAGVEVWRTVPTKALRAILRLIDELAAET